jgi:hypothetical protein
MRVLGTVVEAESGRPLEGLRVRGYDKDLLKDDYLGEVTTDAAGAFELRYSEMQFRDFNETLPDLYLEVYDASGERLLLSTKKEVRRSAEIVERYALQIPRAKLAG